MLCIALGSGSSTFLASSGKASFWCGIAIASTKCSWNRGSKRLYQRTEQCAADDEVGPFAYIRGAHNNTMSECSVRLFYEVPRAKDVDWAKKP